MNIQSSFKEHVRHIDKKLLRRLQILAVIVSVMTGVLAYEVLTSHIHILWILLAVIAGLLVGFIAGRMFSIQWHEEENKVVGKLDLLGGVILVLYVAISIARHLLFEQWFAGSALTAFTLAFIEAAMLSRVLTMRFHIKRVLKEQGKV